MSDGVNENKKRSKSEKIPLEEKVKILCEFAQKYPQYMPSLGKFRGIPAGITEKVEDEELAEKMRQFNKAYYYVSRRFDDGYLPEEIEYKLRSNGVGGLFYMKEQNDVESIIDNANPETKQFSKLQIKKYGSLEELQKNYLQELAYNTYFKKGSDVFVTSIDVASKNLMAEQKYINFCNDAGLGNKFLEHFHVIDSNAINKYIMQMPEKDQEYLKDRYGFDGHTPHTLVQMAAQYGLTRERIRQKCASLLRKICSEAREDGVSLDKTEELGDIYLFINSFINEYGIIKKDSLSREQRNKLLHMVDENILLGKEIDFRNRLIARYCTEADKKEILRNHYGDSVKLDLMETHLKDGNAEIVDLDSAKVTENSKLGGALNVALFDKKNKTIIEQVRKYSENEIKLNLLDELLWKKIQKVAVYVKESSLYEFLKANPTAGGNSSEDKLIVQVGLHRPMTDQEIDTYVCNLEIKNKESKQIRNLPIPETSKMVLKSAKITNVDDFKRIKYDSIMQMYAEIRVDSATKKGKQYADYVGEINLSEKTRRYLEENDKFFLSDLTQDDLESMKNIDREVFNEVMAKSGMINGSVSFKVEKQKDVTDKEFPISTDASIERLNLSNRTYNALKNSGIETLGELLELTDGEIARIRNMGEKCIDEIKGKLNSYRDNKNKQDQNLFINAVSDVTSACKDMRCAVEVKDGFLRCNQGVIEFVKKKNDKILPQEEEFKKMHDFFVKYDEKVPYKVVSAKRYPTIDVDELDKIEADEVLINQLRDLNLNSRTLEIKKKEFVNLKEKLMDVDNRQPMDEHKNYGNAEQESEYFEK